jgi:hypothetical protein
MGHGAEAKRLMSGLGLGQDEEIVARCPPKGANGQDANERR